METVYHSILKGFNWILAGLLSTEAAALLPVALQMSMLVPYAGGIRVERKVTGYERRSHPRNRRSTMGAYNNVLSPLIYKRNI